MAGNGLICPHCSVAVRPVVKDSSVYSRGDRGSMVPTEGYQVVHVLCPNCGSLVVFVVEGTVHIEVARGQLTMGEAKRKVIAYPDHATGRTAPPEVPEELAREFAEATKVLAVSEKASAALGRRILQRVLREHFSIRKRDLKAEIEEFVARPGVPGSLVESIDAVRNIGNFAAHPVKDQNTGEICAVEPGEAEWLVSLLEELFEYAFVAPERAKARKAALNKKLREAGKPEMK